jgi:DNA-directed RNA polymerase specialized sigma54-like protein
MADKLQILREHLPYEIKMLRYTHDRLQAEVKDRESNNVLIESFCLHARNLIDFFRGQRNTKEYACARDFTTKSYRPIDKEIHRQTVYKKLNDQIAHLTYRRAEDPAEKIGAGERASLDAVMGLRRSRWRGDCPQSDVVKRGPN